MGIEIVSTMPHYLGGGVRLGMLVGMNLLCFLHDASNYLH